MTKIIAEFASSRDEYILQIQKIFTIVNELSNER